MNSKAPEEVRKRRAKPSSSPLNIYQKVVLLGGLLTIFLVAGIAPRMASSLSGWVLGAIGTTLLIFFLFKYHKKKKEEGKKVDLREAEIPLHSEEKEVHQQEILPKAEEKMVDPEDVFPEEKKGGDLEEKLLEEPEKIVKPVKIFPEGKEGVVDPKDFPIQAKASDIQKMLLRLEAKAVDIQEMLLDLEARAVHLQERLLKLEEKAAEIQEMHLNPEGKIDMQMILSKLDEGGEKTV